MAYTKLLDIAACLVALWLVYTLYKRYAGSRLGTRLRGPARKSWLWGVIRDLIAQGSGAFESWAEEYGPVYQLPTEIGSEKIVLMDPRAISHVLSTNSYDYLRPQSQRVAIGFFLGNGVLTAEGDDHRRQRKVLNPGFTPQTIRDFMPVFFECVQKIEEAWDAVLAESKETEVTMDVEQWMNRVTFDTIGLTGFSHDFRTLDGEKPTVLRVFEVMSTTKIDMISLLAILLLPIIPWAMKIPTSRSRLFKDLDVSMSEIVDHVLGKEEKSAEQFCMLDPLLKADDDQRLKRSELIAQMKTLMLAGYETTANSLSWCLHELSKHPELQQKLRDEVVQFPEPTYEDLNSQMPILDSIVRETLRVHAPVDIHSRVASVDDSIPLSRPVTTADGDTVNYLDIRAGTQVIVPLAAMNLSRAMWGPTAHDFDPERWTKDELPAEAQEIQGHHHLLTFIDGPRHCIGKNFAVAEFKVVLSSLIRKYVFVPSDGTGENVIKNRDGLLPRPQTQGTKGHCLLMRVRHAES